MNVTGAPILRSLSTVGTEKSSGGKVVSVGVSIHTAVCPECGRTYVSGGTTHSVISTPVNEDKKNPYTQNKNALSKANSLGLVMDFKM